MHSTTKVSVNGNSGNEYWSNFQNEQFLSILYFLSKYLYLYHNIWNEHNKNHHYIPKPPPSWVMSMATVEQDLIILALILTNNTWNHYKNVSDGNNNVINKSWKG